MSIYDPVPYTYKAYSGDTYTVGPYYVATSAVPDSWFITPEAYKELAQEYAKELLRQAEEKRKANEAARQKAAFEKFLDSTQAPVPATTDIMEEISSGAPQESLTDKIRKLRKK